MSVVLPFRPIRPHHVPLGCGWAQRVAERSQVRFVPSADGWAIGDKGLFWHFIQADCTVGVNAYHWPTLGLAQAFYEEWRRPFRKDKSI